MTPDREPITEEELRSVTIGALEPLAERIRLVEYDPRWPALYERKAERVREALGKQALRIEHTGSTSVPGLAAKPVIDMLLVVVDSADEDSYLPPLARAGYTLRVREPRWHEHRMFRGSDPAVNLHVHTLGCPEIDRMLTFRDRLRADAGERLRYERVKRELAEKDWKYVQNYADAKSYVIEEIIARTR
ncbi:MAG: GrpB family protein [Actinomycetota bacterium]